MSLMDFVVSLLAVAEVWPTSEVGTPMRRSYIVLMRWMVIYEYGVPGGALNLNSTTYPDHGHHGDLPLSRKNHRGRAGNRTWDLMISSQKCWPLEHEAGHSQKSIVYEFVNNKIEGYQGIDGKMKWGGMEQQWVERGGRKN
jgi:hypothetical protein